MRSEWDEVVTALDTLIHAAAILSPDGRYRYVLQRTWQPETLRLTFVMLNPSTADATVDDPTIRRCIGFARRQNFGGIRVVNLYAWRATDPRELRRAIDPVGPDNDEHLREALIVAREQKVPVVAAWGTHADAYRVRAVRRLAGEDYPWQSLGVTKDGHPKHPLYVRADAAFISWPATPSGLTSDERYAKQAEEKK